LGSQYTLDGTFTGTIYSNPLPAFAFDATTDGVHNYFVDLGSGTVYQTDRDYTNPVALFTAPGGSGVWEGISYDPLNHSLWLSQGGAFGRSGAGSGVVADYSLSGSLLSFFSTGHGNTALAFDPQDGTIWLNSAAQEGVFSGLEHYSTEGVLLGTLSLSLPPGVRIEEVSGGEFAEAAGKTHKKQKGGPKPTKP
jgi:hypothetical protein